MSNFFNDVDVIKAKRAVDKLVAFAKQASAYPHANFAGLVTYCKIFKRLSLNLVAIGSLSPEKETTIFLHGLPVAALVELRGKAGGVERASANGAKMRSVKDVSREVRAAEKKRGSAKAAANKLKTAKGTGTANHQAHPKTHNQSRPQQAFTPRPSRPPHESTLSPKHSLASST